MRAAFQEIYHTGFQGADIETILKRAGVTKGALYHHFDGKEKLGYAVVDEVIDRINYEKWVVPLAQADNPIDALIAILRGTSLEQEYVNGGCPVNNLAQELSPLDAGFRRRLARLFGEWQESMAAALRRGQERGLVRADLDPEHTATWLAAQYEGFVSLAKNAQNPAVLDLGIRTITQWLETLRASQ